MTSNKIIRRWKIRVLLLSRVTVLAVFIVLLSSSVRVCHGWPSQQLRHVPTSISLYNYPSQLHAIADIDIDSNAIIGRQDFITDLFWSATSSSIAVATATTTTATPTTTTMPTTTTTNNSVENVCRNGALMGESAVPGAYSSACMGLSERIVPLPKYRERMTTIATELITAANANKNNKNKGEEVQQQHQSSLQPGTIVVQQRAGGSGNTGMTVWNSGLLLTRLLDVMVDELQRQQRQRGGGSNNKNDNNGNDNDNTFWRNQDVLELGCGTGLCSIAAHRLGAKSVVATDGNPRVLELADANIQQNCYSIIDGDGDGAIANPTNPTSLLAPSGSSLPTIRAESLQWGFLNAMDYSEGASFIIGADLTYNPGSWRVLAETIATVLKTENNNIDASAGTTASSNQCYALYLSVGHDGFNVNAEMDGFLSVAKEVGLVSIPDGVEGIDLSELLLSTLSDPEKKILAQGGGVRVAVLGRKRVLRF